MGNVWRRCSSCKHDIGFETTFWVCSVSTCNRKRTGLAFCTTECWDAHLGFVNHRECWAIEKRSPSAGGSAPTVQVAGPPERRGAGERAPRRRIYASAEPKAESTSQPSPQDILIVASRLKDYIRARSGMNTSDAVMQVLSKEVRRSADRAIANARRAERKTVLERDFPLRD